MSNLKYKIYFHTYSFLSNGGESVLDTFNQIKLLKQQYNDN